LGETQQSVSRNRGGSRSNILPADDRLCDGQNRNDDERCRLYAPASIGLRFLSVDTCAAHLSNFVTASIAKSGCDRRTTSKEKGRAKSAALLA
jgi:hypothetical protein